MPSVANLLLVLSAVYCAGASDLRADKAKQPKSNKQPVQHNLHHNGLLTSYSFRCPAQAHQNSGRIRAQQPKSNRQSVQHHLCHQWQSHYLLCQQFSAQAHQNSDRTRRSSLNPIDNLYNIIRAISSFLVVSALFCAVAPEL